MGNAVTQVTDASFETDVLAASLPVLVDYWAEWCGPCKMIGPMVEESAGTYAGRLSVAKLNVDENPKAPSQFHIRSIPTLMIFKDGKPVATKVGALSKSQLAEFIEQHL